MKEHLKSNLATNLLLCDAKDFLHSAAFIIKISILVSIGKNAHSELFSLLICQYYSTTNIKMICENITGKKYVKTSVK